jgi:RNA polymerase sigma-70 factor (ECF subfamily)
MGTDAPVTAAEFERSSHDVVSRPDLPALVELARAGDTAAWEELYRHVYPRLLAYAARQLGGERARDAVSETMTRAVAKIERFSWRGAGFEGWLFAILRNIIVDTHRRDNRSTTFADMPESLSPVGNGSAEPGDRLIADEEARAVRAAFARLRPEDQELLYLRVVAGLSSEEAAEVLGKRRGAVRTAQSRALSRLRELLQDDRR